MAASGTASITPALTARSELLTAAEASEIARRLYGLAASAHPLSGEKDSNFRLDAMDGAQYLLKVVNPGEEAAVTNMHTLALLHVAARDPGMPVQAIVPTRDGQPEFRLDRGEGDCRTVRLVTFTQGILQRKTVQTPVQRRNAGIMLGRLQEALADFRHPAEDHVSTWDMKHALSLKGMLDDLEDGGKRAELCAWLDRFADEVLPDLGRLRSQVVHNDLNSDNIVVDPANTDEITGIIDFGDMVKTAVLFDVAVAAAYQLTDADDPLRAANEFIAGFHSRRPLHDREVALLFTTIMARMVMRIAITEWRAVRFPENRAYILRNTPQAWLQFHRLAAIPSAKATDAIASALSV
ncbi:phosphotransferase [Shinella daejeonensis]|uniref:phosphotransferase n=1 Tax=Shinella daejeonensis TaxID=659017 RepID=UPI0020C7DCB8|nr:phosphotransferase [Shinella daejeonensis]MCP8896200.1 phosphotransferase [Shinella daejeonensis]